MDFKEINQIIDKFNNSTLRELEINEGQFHLRLSKNENMTPVVNSVEKNINTNTSENVSETKNLTDVTTENVIKSPMVGTVYLQPEPGKDKYVTKGSKVKQGDVVCIIEAMKMMTEVKSNVSGVIEDVLVENEDLIEFDQPLFKVKEG